MTTALTERPIAIASDHRAVALKARIAAWLRANGYGVTDCGVDDDRGRVDAMDYALKLVDEIAAGRSDFAVGLCGSGQMMAITANRFPFIRATLLHAPEEAASARQHGDANMLILGADHTDEAAALAILATFLTTAPLGDRYAERRERLARLGVTGVSMVGR